MQQQNRVLGEDERVSGMSEFVDERTLLQQFVKQNDQEAFSALMKLHGPMVYGVCRRILRDSHDADDAFQATFVILARKASSIRTSEFLSSWLHQVAHRTSMKAKFVRLRRRQRECVMEQLPPTPIEDQDLWPEVEPWLDEELNSLPEQYRLPIIVCDLQGKTHKEAARELNIPEGTFSNRLVKAREILAHRLTRRGVILSAGALTVVMSENAASAAVPAALYNSTASAISSISAGNAASSSALSKQVMLLARDGTTLTATGKLILAALATAGVFVGTVAIQQKADPKPVGIRTSVDAAKELQMLGARLLYEGGNPQRPVTGIKFHQKNRFADQHMYLLKSFKKLNTLSLRSTSVTDECFKDLADINSIVNLDFSNTQITGKNFSLLKDLKSLLVLNLDSTRITDASLKDLSVLPNLGALLIRSCDISDAGLKNLLTTQMKDNLQNLFLDSTQVTDAGLEELSSFKKLHLLSLGGSSITTAAIPHLKQLHQLKQLHLEKTTISNEELKELFQQLPQLQQLGSPTGLIDEAGEITVAKHSTRWSSVLLLVIGNGIVVTGIAIFMIRKRMKSR